MMLRGVVALIVLQLAWPASSIAQSAGSEDEAYGLAAIEAGHEVCGFALTDEQETVMEQRREALTTQGQTSESELAALQGQLAESLAAQRQEGVCREDGPEAKLYRRRLSRFGLL